jgi:hypothetical protein
MKTNDYLHCIKMGSLDYIKDLKSDMGKINFLFSNLCFSILIEAVTIVK